MKTAQFDLAPAVLMVVVGGAFAFILCNLLLPKISDESFSKLEYSVESSVATPDEEIFNTKAINPTVEVCVGCSNGNEADLEDNLEDDIEDSEGEE